MAQSCAHCGRQLAQDAVFCDLCGAPVQPIDTTIQTSPADKPDPQAADAPLATTPAAFDSPQVEVFPASTATLAVEDMPDFAAAPVLPDFAAAPVLPDPDRAAPPARPHGAVRGVLATVSVLLTLLLFGTMCAALLLHTARAVLTEERVADVIREMDIVHMNIRPFLNTDEIPADEEVTVATYIYQCYEAAYAGEIGPRQLTESGIERFLERSDFKGFVTDKVNAYIEDMYRDNGAGQITAADITGFIEDNEQLIYEMTGGYWMTERDYTLISDQIGALGLTKSLDVTTFKAQNAALYGLFHHLLAPYALFALLALCLIWLILIALVNRRQLSNVAFCAGIPALLIGVITGLLQLCADIILRALAALAFGQNALRPVVSAVLAALWQSGRWIGLAGVLLIAVFVIARGVRRRRETVLPSVEPTV